MAKRVGVILSGCGHDGGSDPAETLLALLIADRAGAQVLCAAPEAVRADAARMLPPSPDGAPAEVRPLQALDVRDVDALLIPGGGGIATVLSDYAEKGQLCQVHPDVTRLLRAMLPARKPMGFFGLSAVLAARVLGPVAGVRLTLGPKATTAAKHAAIMGADMRPATVDDLIVDQKALVFSTPGFLGEAAHLAAVARTADKLVRALLGAARDRAPAPPPGTATVPGAPGRGARPPNRPTGRARGSA